MCDRSRTVALSLVLLLIVPALCAQEERKSQTAKEQYETLLRDYERASAAWRESGKGLTAANPAWIEHYAARPVWSFAPRFLQFAEANSKTPEAVEALLHIVGIPEPGDFSDRSLFPVVTRVFRLLASDHLQDERVAAACLARVRFAGAAIDPYLQALLAKSQDREIRAYACWELALKSEAELHYLERTVAPRPDPGQLRKALEYLNSRRDPEFIKLTEAIDKADKAVIFAESEALLERVISEFGDVPFPPRWSKAKREGETLADFARPKLDALRNIAVGKVAPDIEGEDIHGKPMRLSDYRGRLVVIVFWGTWCGPCRGLIPHEKALVERFKDRPFALLGVNSDSDREKLQATMEKQGITWRSWWDGGKIGGPIARRWDVAGWPTIIVVDDRGVIRYKNFPHYAHKELADAIDHLLSAMAHEDDGGTAKR